MPTAVTATAKVQDVAVLTPTAGRLALQRLRPSVTASLDLARARGKTSGTGEPSRFPGEPPLWVGSGAHAADVKLLQRLGIKAVLNCAPSVCRDPVSLYRMNGIRYSAIDAQDDRSFPLLDRCLKPASEFIRSAHEAGDGVLVHCMAGVNRSATLSVAYLLERDRRCLLELFAECVAARPCILQNPSFQLQLCERASREGLLYKPGPPSATPGAPAAPAAAAASAASTSTASVGCAAAV